jgi:hypothetical protein
MSQCGAGNNVILLDETSQSLFIVVSISNRTPNLGMLETSPGEGHNPHFRPDIDVLRMGEPFLKS